MKKTNLKNNLLKLFVAVFALIIALSFAPLNGQARQAFADGPYEEFVETVEVSQSQFEVGDLTTMPSTPSAWTGDYIGGLSGNVKSGVLTLKSAYITNHESTMLSIYPEYKDKNNIPATPFGKTSTNPQGGNYYENTNKNVLMINTNKSITAYGYTSEDIALEPNSFYSFSAWVKTGNFSADEGAAITITGLKEAAGIWNIDTVSDLATVNGLPNLTEANNWGWKQYTIYVGTGTSSETVKIQLSVGDSIEGHMFSSQGYAFFDNISAQKLSPTYFYERISGTLNDSTVYDMNSYDYAVASVGGVETEIGNFDSGKSGWTVIYDEDTSSNGRIDFNAYNAGSAFVEDTSFGLNSDPYSPKGKFEPFNNIMVLSSYQKNKESFDKVQAGIKSPNITIEKETNYELSVWYNTQQMDGEASIVISGQSTQLSNQYKITPVEVGSLTTNSNKQRYGWQRANIYIKGSVVMDVSVNVELWMGHASPASGIAMFDDITLRKISSSEYNTLSTSSTVVVIDSGAPVSGVPNGQFSEADYAEQDELKNVYPLTPTSWTFIDAETAKLANHSSRAVNYSNAVYGIVPTNNAHYAQHESDYGFAPNPYQHESRGNKNALFMYSPDKTVFGYRSDAIAITAETYSIIKVKLFADCDGAGVSLVLKNGSKVISTIEKITNTLDMFKTYEFYVSGSSADVSLNIELWFGLTDKYVNNTKRTSGYAFIDSVELETTEEAVFTEKFEQYNSIANMIERYTDFAAYKLGNFDFSAYDRYSNSVVKDAYDFSFSSTSTISNSGVIADVDANQTVLPSYYSKANSAVEGRFNTTLYLKNNEPAQSRLASENSFALLKETYYKIEFSLLVDLAEKSHTNAVGAGIWLDSYGIENIRNTLDEGVVVGKGSKEYSPAFNTFTFFYATGAEDEMVKWALTLGAKEYPNQRITGQMFCNKVTVTVLDSYYFDDEMATLLKANDDADEVDDIYGYKLIDKSVAKSEEETVDPIETDTDATATTNPNGTSSPWYLVPSVVFMIAILIALVGVVTKKLLAHRGGKRIKRTVSYDRKLATIKPVKNNIEDETVNTEVYEPATQTHTFESFDDEAVEDTSKQARKAARRANAPADEVDEFVDAVVTETEVEKPKAEKPQEKEINEFDE